MFQYLTFNIRHSHDQYWSVCESKFFLRTSFFSLFFFSTERSIGDHHHSRLHRRHRRPSSERRQTDIDREKERERNDEEGENFSQRRKNKPRRKKREKRKEKRRRERERDKRGDACMSNSLVLLFILSMLIRGEKA